MIIFGTFMLNVRSVLYSPVQEHEADSLHPLYHGQFLLKGKKNRSLLRLRPLSTQKLVQRDLGPGTLDVIRNY